MANGYETPAEDAADTMPESPAEDTGEGGKISQQQANYREGNPQRSCGLCANFTGSAGEGAFQCTKVDGKISPFGFSDLYERQDNPFREGETGEFTGGTPVNVIGQQPTTPTEMAVARATAAGPPPTLGGPNQPGGGTATAAISPPPQISNPRVAQTGVMRPPGLRIGGKMYQ